MTALKIGWIANGDRISAQYDQKADAAAENGRDKLVDRLSAKGDRIDQRLDNKGDHIDQRLDRKGNQVERKHDRRAEVAQKNGYARKAQQIERKGHRSDH